MTNEAEGNFNQPDYTKYRESVNSKAKPYGEKLVGERNYNLLKFMAIGAGIFCIILLYLVYSGYTKDEIDLQCSEIPECPTAPACPEMNCPVCENNCAVTCGDFPSDLNLNLVNETE